MVTKVIWNPKRSNLPITKAEVIALSDARLELRRMNEPKRKNLTPIKPPVETPKLVKRKGKKWPGEGIGGTLRMLNNARANLGLAPGPPSPYKNADGLVVPLGLPDKLMKMSKRERLNAVAEEIRRRAFAFLRTDVFGMPEKAVKTPKKPKSSPVAYVPTVAEKEEFYQSWDWTTLRMQTIKRYGAVCMCCGAKKGAGVVINVDHIKPLSRYWHMRLDAENLQILCHPCNKGKGAWDETDWRPQ